MCCRCARWFDRPDCDESERMMGLMFRRRRPLMRLAAAPRSAPSCRGPERADEDEAEIDSQAAEPPGDSSPESEGEAAEAVTMADNDARAAQLVRALEVSVLGDASRLEELFTTDVTGLSPILSCSSLEEFAVELEEQEDVFTEVEIEVHPLDVAGDRACVEWVASAVHSGPLPLDEDETVVIEGSGRRVSLRGGERGRVRRRQDLGVPPLLGRRGPLRRAGAAPCDD